jgi:hypothetical protein
VSEVNAGNIADRFSTSLLDGSKSANESPKKFKSFWIFQVAVREADQNRQYSQLRVTEQVL